MWKKLNYETPEVEVIALTPDGAIAGSPETSFSVVDPFDDITEEEW